MLVYEKIMDRGSRAIKADLQHHSLSVFVHIYCLKAGLEHTSVCISVNMLLQVTGNIKYKQVAFSRKQLSFETWAGAT